MAIYADKRNGKLTGRWRVELQRGTDRYRKRHDSYQEAVEDEKRVLAAWDAGEDPNAPQEAPEAPTAGITLEEAIKVAKGLLWRNLSSEDGNWQTIGLLKKAIGGNTVVDDIDTLKVREFVRKLDEREVSNATVNRYLSHVRTFLNWLHTEPAKYRKDPIDGIKWDWRKEKNNARMRWLTFEEEDKIVSRVPAGTGKLIKVAIATGCRREELLSLKPHQVDQTGDEDGLLQLWDTKNGDSRTVPISADTARMIRELLGGEMPTKRTLRRHWDKAKKDMGLEHDKEFVFHTCRHTCATRMVDADVDILVIKEWLGHKRLETTQRYAKVKAKKLHSILARVGGLRPVEAKNPPVSAAPHAPPQASPGGVMSAVDLAA